MTTTATALLPPLVAWSTSGLCCLCLVLLTTGIHYEALGAIGVGVERLVCAARARLVVVVLGLFAAHVAEVAAYAVTYWMLAGHAGLGTLGPAGHAPFSVALYFSLETYSSLGYGDVVPSGALRLLAGAEALNGLLLIGWSASYAHIAMERYWRGGKR